MSRSGVRALCISVSIVMYNPWDGFGISCNLNLRHLGMISALVLVVLGHFESEFLHWSATLGNDFGMTCSVARLLHMMCFCRNLERWG